MRTRRSARVAQITTLLFAATFLDACDDRAPESALFGTWEITVPQGLDTKDWIAFNKDHSFVWFIADGTQEKIDDRGSWYAGGKNLYMRHEGDGKKYVWNIIAILPNELRLSYEKVPTF
jgi:hypothetical protein